MIVNVTNITATLLTAKIKPVHYTVQVHTLGINSADKYFIIPNKLNNNSLMIHNVPKKDQSTRLNVTVAASFECREQDFAWTINCTNSGNNNMTTIINYN